MGEEIERGKGEERLRRQKSIKRKKREQGNGVQLRKVTGEEKKGRV